MRLPLQATIGLPQEAIDLMCEYKLLHDERGVCIGGEDAAAAAHDIVVEYDKTIKEVRDETAEAEAKANHRMRADYIAAKKTHRKPDRELIRAWRDAQERTRALRLYDRVFGRVPKEHRNRYPA